MTEEEKEAIEYLKARLYGNEGCKFIDVAQSDLKIFLNLIQKQEKIIDKMAENLAGLAIWNNHKEEPLILWNKEMVIDYYERQVEENELYTSWRICKI